MEEKKPQSAMEVALQMQQSENEPTMQQASSQNLSEKSREIINIYKSREDFMKRINPDVQKLICHDANRCHFGAAPTLGEINAAFGSNTASAWLVPQLYNLSEYCGCKDKLTGNELKECAQVIANEYYFLKVSELMLFFYRFKFGKYGRFYGSVDPMIVTTSLQSFMKERDKAYEAKEREERDEKERESRRGAISWEEYSMRKYGKVVPSPFARLAQEKEQQETSEENNETTK